MKRFIIKIISFFVIVLTVDTLLGYVFGYLQSHSKGGETYRREYIANTMTDSILIMGSSRARHHYDPRILIDSLGFSSFNCGLSGNGIICNYGQYSMLSERYAPKIIIYDVFLNLDLNTFYPNEHYIDGLRPYYDRYGIDSIFFAVDVTEKYKMLSQMRKYNGYFTTLLLNYLKPRIDHTRGFRPLYGKLDYGNKPQETEKKIQDVDSLPYDPLKLMYIKRLIKETRQKGTRLIFCISPIYGGGDDSVYQPVMNMAAENGIPLLNHYNDTLFIFKKEYFKDSVHLNSDGAEAYTQIIASEIKEIVK